MYRLKTEATFDSAHFLYGYDGKCRNIHGHTWRVAVEVSSLSLIDEGQTRGMIIDFSELKSKVRDLCEGFDHCLIYEVGTLKQNTVDALNIEGFKLKEVSFRPTAENFAKAFFTELKQIGLHIKRVEVYETATNCASYEE